MSDQRSTPGESLPPVGSPTPRPDPHRVDEPGTSSAVSPEGSSGPGSTSPSSTTTGPDTNSPAPSRPAGKQARRGKAGGDDPLRGSRTSGLWVAVVGAGLLLILLIIFIVQNTQRVKVDFLGWSGNPPLAVALLVAAAAGILITGLIGTLRILQLRRRVKRAEK